MFVLPVDCVIKFYLVDKLSEIMQDGNRKPLPAVLSSDFIPVLPLVFFKLNVVQNNKTVGLDYLGKIAQPGKGLGLMNRANHIIRLTIGRLSIILDIVIDELHLLGGIMGTIIKSCVILAVVSLILGLVSRFTMHPFFVEAQAYLQFAQYCFLAAITFLLYKIAYKIED
jgi:hypothetical protein